MVPVTGLVKLTALVEALSQSVWFGMALTVAVGLTVMTKLLVVPVHPLAVGVTVIVPLMGVLVRLVAVNDGMLPFPLAARPMAGLLLAQAKVVPLTGPVMVTAAEAAPLHKVWLLMLVTVGVG